MREELHNLFFKLALTPMSDESLRYVNLFHYTSNRSKNEIVKDNYVDFCLSRTDDFLDQNEGVQILEPFYLACGILYEEGEIDGECYWAFRNIRADTLRKQNTDIWILCLTPNGDSKYMKARYAAKDGWVIGVPELSFEELWHEFPEEIGTVKLSTVEYSFEKMCDTLKSDIIKIYKCYRECLENDVYENKEKAIAILEKLMIQYLLMRCHEYKSSDYKSEEEVRFICCLKQGLSRWESEDGSIEMFVSVEKNTSKLHLRLEKNKSLYCCTNKLEWENSKESNKSVLTSNEIREYANKLSNNK